MLITSTGHGKFRATNGIDEVTAEYFRGKKDEGRYKPHWIIHFNGAQHIIYGGKGDAENKVIELLCGPRSNPLEDCEAISMQKLYGCVYGIISVELDEAVNLDRESFLDMLNNRLTNLPLNDISYHIVAVINEDGKTLAIRVNGTLEEGVCEA